MKLQHTDQKFSSIPVVLLLCAFLLALLSSPAGAADDITVTGAVNRTQFPMDQAVLFSVTVNGARSAKPEMPRADGLQFSYQGQSSQMQWINGKGSSSITFSFMVQGLEAGRHTIEPVRVTVDGKVYTTKPVTCTVLKSTAVQTPPAGRQGMQPQQNNGPAARLRSGEADKIGFMRIRPKTDTIYSGQLVPFTIKAYFRQGLRVTLKSAPRFTGENFILQSIDDKPVQQDELVNGERYTSLTWHGALSAVKEGTFPLDVEMDASLLVRSGSRQQSSPFGSMFSNDPFFDDFFAQYSRRDVKVASPEKSITVKDLPTAGRPDNFTGAIGTYSLAVAADPKKSKVGDPITLKMIVSGSGNFGLVQAPTLTDLQGWKTYPAAESFSEQGPGRGEKTFEQAIVPTTDSLHQIPAIAFSYFDPDAGEYITLTSDPIPIELAKSSRKSAASVPTTVDTRQVTAQPQAGPGNLAPLHTEQGKTVTALVPLYTKSWFIVAMALALICLIAAWVLYIRRRRLEKDPTILQNRELRSRLNNHLEKMQQAMSEGKQSEFIHHGRAAIQHQYGILKDQEAQSITLADLEQWLPEENPLLEIFNRLEHAGYSGEVLDQATMESMTQTLRKELESQ
jgi:hypothetical protein